eukprot:COSAG01_NODE_5460_length_4252_cov_7.235974_8_plen_163_part_00
MCRAGRLRGDRVGWFDEASEGRYPAFGRYLAAVDLFMCGLSENTGGNVLLEDGGGSEATGGAGGWRNHGGARPGGAPRPGDEPAAGDGGLLRGGGGEVCAGGGGAGGALCVWHGSRACLEVLLVRQETRLTNTAVAGTRATPTTPTATGESWCAPSFVLVAC